MTNSIEATTGVDEHPGNMARRLALGTVLGPVVLTLTWLVLGFLSTGYTLFGHRFTDYSPISQPISGLGMGSTAPYMNTAFVVTGLLTIAGVVGVFRTIKSARRPLLRRGALVLLGCTGVGQVMVGIFNLEAIMLHTLGFVLALGHPDRQLPANRCILSHHSGAVAPLRQLAPTWQPTNPGPARDVLPDVPAHHRRCRAWHCRPGRAHRHSRSSGVVRRYGLAGFETAVP